MGQGFKLVSSPDIKGLGIDFVNSSSATLLNHVPEPTNAALRPLAGFAVTIRNSGSRTPLALVLRYSLERADGGDPVVQQYLLENLDRTKGIERLQPGRQHVMWPLSSVGGQADLRDSIIRMNGDTANLEREAREQAILFTAVPSIQATIDSVVLEDGRFVGPDVGGNFERLRAWVSSERDLLAALATRLKAGGPAKATQEWLQQIAASRPTGSLLRPNFDHYRFRQSGFASALARLIDAQGPEEVLRLVEATNKATARLTSIYR
jgi:hypothetical protein